ncbi:SRPBCC family protein [Mycobacterium sp. EPa45]|uniref:SRPBCC family protein n=1 Tax=Mycobacterium sp. EPa45 TaxID=1545728 RepID=UPI000642249B|nr:SRPBCC family protein [Mycobacterium sp. EPa45]AKK26024.1 ATPase [Mycobacterium sp. EPa45]
MTIQSTPDVHVTRSITVPLEPAAAFDLFTSRMTEFWPSSHSIGANPFVAVEMEPRVGGRWYERSADGVECSWGRVLAWEPPHRVVLAWQLNADWTYDPEFETDVEVSFTETEPCRTNVLLRHGHLERFGERAAEMQATFKSSGAWESILAAYRGAA